MLKHWYHIYSEGGNWKAPVEEHLIALKKSGLSEALDYFGVGIVGNLHSRNQVKDFIVKSGIKFDVAVESNLGWEQITLDVIECEDEDKILYAHSKGAAYPNTHSDDWRRSMTEGVVYRWRRAVELLAEVDSVGCYWMPYHGGPPRHFSGNFWWCKGEYFNRIPRPVPVNSRWDAEMWVGGGRGLMYDLVSGGPMAGNWLYEEALGQKGVPDGCVRLLVTNTIASMERGSIVVRVLDPAINMLIREGHVTVLGENVEKVYDYRE